METKEESIEAIKKGNIALYNFIVEHKLLDYFFQSDGLFPYDTMMVLSYIFDSKTFHYNEYKLDECTLTSNHRKIVIFVLNKKMSFEDFHPIIKKVDRLKDWVYIDAYDLSLEEPKIIEIDILK